MHWPGEAQWDTPEALSVLTGTPINCLVAAKPSPKLKELAAARGLAAVTADEAKSRGVVVPGDTVWPGVKLGRRGEAESAPTGPPWVDSNGWRSLLAAAQSPGKPVWIIAEAPGDQVLRAQHYVVAVVDAAAHGGRWVVSLQADVRKGLLAKEASAVEVWKSITGALSFFEKNRAWLAQPTLARFGVISDFAGENEFMGHEILNLAPRRYLSCRIIDPRKVDASALKGLRGAIWVDEKPPQGAALSALMGFAAAGGTLIVPHGAAAIVPKTATAKPHKTGYKVYAQGKGFIAVPPEAWSDPYVVVTDSHLLISHKHDVYRIFNSGATNVRCTEAPNGGAVMHVINYTGRPAYQPVSVYVARPYKNARWSNLSKAEMESIAVAPAAEGVEVHLPQFAAYAAIEFGGQA
jgi:hypothetical protein